MKTSSGQVRQNEAYKKFINRGSSTANRNSAAFARSANMSKAGESGFYPAVTSSSNKFVNNQVATRAAARSMRPNTGSTLMAQQNRLNNPILPKNVHDGTSMHRRDMKGRQVLQSATVKQSEQSRLASQKEIKVPHSQYGVKPVTTYGSYGKRPSALPRFASNDSLSKEASIKKLRMGSYMGNNNSQSNMLGASRKRNETNSRSASRQHKALAMSKSPMRQHSQMSASKLESRASLLETSFNGVQQFPTINFKGDEDFALKILDNMIQIEEDQT